MGELRNVRESITEFPECVDLSDTKHVFQGLGLVDKLLEMSLDEAFHFLSDWLADKKRRFLANPKKLRLIDIEPGGEFRVFFASMGQFEHFVHSYMRLEVVEKKIAKGDRSGSLLEWTLADRDRWQLEVDNYFNLSGGKVITGLYKRFCEALALIAAKRDELLELEAQVELVELEKESSELAEVVDRPNRSYRADRTYMCCEVFENVEFSKQMEPVDVAKFAILPYRSRQWSDVPQANRCYMQQFTVVLTTYRSYWSYWSYLSCPRATGPPGRVFNL